MRSPNLRKVVVFVVTLANCGVKAAHATGMLERAADFLPVVADLPDFVTMDVAGAKAEWSGLTPESKAELVAEVAADLDLEDAHLTKRVDALFAAGLDMVTAFAAGVAAWTAA